MAQRRQRPPDVFMAVEDYLGEGPTNVDSERVIVSCHSR
jgi:hypothetical protein